MREAGELARATARQPFKRWTKGAEASPVTEGDIVVNDFLYERLSMLVGSAGWLSEESDNQLPEPTLPLVWIVDPIDGTRAYISSRADWTISVALAERSCPLVATPITVTPGEMLAGAKLAGPKRHLKQLSGISPEIVPQPKVHSLALRIARVAQGALEVAVASGGSHDWDLAAADLLMHEAGGALTDFAGQPLKYHEPQEAHGALIAAGHARHAALIELVRDRETEFA